MPVAWPVAARVESADSPPSWPDSSASTMASGSQMPPLAVLTSHAPFFILPSNSLLNMFLQHVCFNTSLALHRPGCCTSYTILAVLYSSILQSNFAATRTSQHHGQIYCSSTPVFNLLMLSVRYRWLGEYCAYLVLSVRGKLIVITSHFLMRSSISANLHPSSFSLSSPSFL